MDGLCFSYISKFASYLNHLVSGWHCQPGSSEASLINIFTNEYSEYRKTTTHMEYPRARNYQMLLPPLSLKAWEEETGIGTWSERRQCEEGSRVIEALAFDGRKQPTLGEWAETGLGDQILSPCSSLSYLLPVSPKAQLNLKLEGKGRPLMQFILGSLLGHSRLEKGEGGAGTLHKWVMPSAMIMLILESGSYSYIWFFSNKHIYFLWKENLSYKANISWNGWYFYGFVCVGLVLPSGFLLGSINLLNEDSRVLGGKCYFKPQPDQKGSSIFNF